MNNKALLVVIAVLLVGILSIMVIQNQKENRSFGERVADSVEEGVEEIGDEIDDHTTSPN